MVRKKPKSNFALHPAAWGPDKWMKTFAKPLSKAKVRRGRPRFAAQWILPSSVEISLLFVA